MYKQIYCPICEKKKILGDWRVKYDNITRVKTAVKSYIAEYKVSKLLSQIRVEASRLYNQMMTPVVGLRNNCFKKTLFF